jgi:hypothetical protein
MKLDWAFLARNLAAHLAAATSMENVDRILQDAQRDAAQLLAPPEFWSYVSDEYGKQASQRGVEARDDVRAALRRVHSNVQQGDT